jgi:hypothetical protein
VTNTIRTMRALVLTLAATAAVVSACGGSSGEPQTAPPVSTSPASVSSPTPAAGDVPAAAKAATSAGAEAFAKFFYVQVKRAFEEKNPDLVKSLSAPGCASCDRFIGSITKLRDNNERVENFNMNVTLAVAPAVTGNTARVDISWTSPLEMVRYDASGKVLTREGPFKRADDQMNLVRDGDGWRVGQLKTLRILK